MRFASIGGSNAASYAAAGKAVADSGAKMFKKQRDSGPDFGMLSQVAMKTASAEKIAGMKAEAHVTKVGIDTYSDNKRVAIGIKRDEKIRDAKGGLRKAGMIAAVGKIAGAGFLSASDNSKNRKYPTADRAGFDSAYKAKRDALISNNDKQRDALHSESESHFDKLRNRSASTNASASSGANSGKVTGQSASPAIAVNSGTSLSGNAKLVADAVAGPESGDWGYEAFNQGGAANGTKVVGKSGSYKDTYGTSLTAMSLGEIFHKQNTKQRGLSMNEHINSGGLHAVGRYQFIGSTLQDEVKRMGISLDTKFTPEVQDKIFVNHIKRVGNISPWVGPSTKWDQSRKNHINSLIPTL